MKTVYIERSTGNCRTGEWAESVAVEGAERIVVGTGPGSFAGIRSALAFAQGYALGSGCEVLGLPSPCAIAAAHFAEKGMAVPAALAVVGDARQGKFWVALFEGCRLVSPVFQVDREGLERRVPMGAVVLSPDDGRIAATLGEVFGERYRGEALPTAEGLRLYAERTPEALTPEPLPIYLNPAVRP